MEKWLSSFPHGGQSDRIDVMGFPARLVAVCGPGMTDTEKLPRRLLFSRAARHHVKRVKQTSLRNGGSQPHIRSQRCTTCDSRELDFRHSWWCTLIAHSAGCRQCSGRSSTSAVRSRLLSASFSRSPTGMYSRSFTPVFSHSSDYASLAPASPTWTGLLPSWAQRGPKKETTAW